MKHKKRYRGTDVLFLQEVANAFKASVQARQLGAEYHVLSPAENDPNRDQNSMILLRKARLRNDVAGASRISPLNNGSESQLPTR